MVENKTMNSLLARHLKDFRTMGEQCRAVGAEQYPDHPPLTRSRGRRRRRSAREGRESHRSGRRSRGDGRTGNSREALDLPSKTSAKRLS